MTSENKQTPPEDDRSKERIKTDPFLDGWLETPDLPGDSSLPSWSEQDLPDFLKSMSQLPSGLEPAPEVFFPDVLEEPVLNGITTEAVAKTMLETKTPATAPEPLRIEEIRVPTQVALELPPADLSLPEPPSLIADLELPDFSATEALEQTVPNLGVPDLEAPNLETPILEVPDSGMFKLPGEIPLPAWLGPIAAEAAPMLPEVPERAEAPVSVGQKATVPEFGAASANAPAPQSAAGIVMERLVVPTLKKTQRLAYGMVATNGSPTPLFQARIEHDLPIGVRFLGADPPPEVKGRRLTWNLGDLPPGYKRNIRVQVEVAANKNVRPSDFAVFRSSYDLRNRLTKPKLMVSLSTPPNVLNNTPATVQVLLSNKGNGAAQNLQTQIQLPPGLKHPQGDRLGFKVGSLTPGESVRLTIQLLATQTGKHPIQITATADGGNRASGGGELQVIQPALLVNLSGSANCFVEEEQEFRLDIWNPGTAPAQDVWITYSLPNGTALVSDTEFAVHDPMLNQLTWTVESLSPGERKTWQFRLQAGLPGDSVHRIKADAKGGIEAHMELPLSIDFPQQQGAGLLDQLLREMESEIRLPSSPEQEAAITEEITSTAEQHLVFALAGTEYAVPLANLLEIGRTLQVTPVPNVPEWIEGVANFRGDVISMVNLRSFLGLPQKTMDHQDRLLVVKARNEEMAAGLVVDRVRGIRTVFDHKVAPGSAGIENRITPYMRGVAEDAGKLLILLNLDHLLLSSEMRQFESV